MALTVERAEWRKLALVLAALALPLVASFSPWQPGALSPWGLRVLGVVAAGVVLWISEVVPIAVSSFVVIVLLALVAPGESNEAIRSALVGFAAPAPFFLLGALALGASTVKSGLAQRFARFLARGARGSGDRLYWQMLAMVPLMAVLVPSALTRTVMLIPAYEEVFRIHRIERGHPLPPLVMLATALLQVQASTAVLTGGAVPVVASSLIGGMSWGRWFAYMAVPNYAILFLVGIVLWLIYRPGEMPPPEPGSVDDDALASPPMSAVEWRALLITGGTTLLWLTDSFHHLDPTIPALIGASLVFLPVIGVLEWRDYEAASPWSVFLVTGSSLSLGIALERSGAASWLASSALGRVPLEDLPLVAQVLALVAVVAAVNVVLPNRTAVLSICIPLVMSLASTLGLNPFAAGLIVPIVTQTTVYYPVQLATALVTFRTRHYTTAELARAGVVLTTAALLVIFAIALPWWGLLGEGL